MVGEHGRIGRDCRDHCDRGCLEAQRLFEPGEEVGRPLDVDFDAALVAYPSPQPQVVGQAVDERPKAHPLNRTADADADRQG